MRLQKTEKGGIKLNLAANLVLSLSISYPYFIKFHDFAENSQEGMKHQMRGPTQAQEGMTFWITLISQNF
jgi:hypothetical protein